MSNNPWPFEKENPLILVPAGTFDMGSKSGDSDETPIRKITLSGFYMTKTPITVGQYRRFLEDSKSTSVLPDHEFNYKGDDYPVVCLTWKEARAFCRYYGADLPTAAQEERAAKGKSGKDKFGTPIDLAVIYDNEARTTALVTGPESVRRQNDFGFVDLAGNVWDWTSDRYEKDWYKRMPDQNPHNPLTDPLNQTAELRGGSWSLNRGNARAADRLYVDPTRRWYSFGFRPAWPQDSVY